MQISLQYFSIEFFVSFENLSDESMNPINIKSTSDTFEAILFFFLLLLQRFNGKEQSVKQKKN